MSQRVRACRRQTGRASPRATGARWGRTLEPRLQRLIDLQRSAGNAAVVQLVGDEAGPATAAPGADTATADDEAEAKAVFDLGAAAFDKGDFAHAADFFTRAVEIAHRPGILFSRARRCAGSAAGARRRSRCYEDYLAASDDPVRKADAESATSKELKDARGGPASSRPRTLAAGKKRASRGARRSTRRATTRTPTTSSRSPARWSTAPRCCSRPRPGAAAARRPARGGDRALRGLHGDATNPTRKADAERGLKELRGPAKTGDSEADVADRRRRSFEKGAVVLRARATTRTPTTSSADRRRADRAAEMLVLAARRRCAGSAAAGTRRSSSTRTTSTAARRAARPRPRRSSSSCSRRAPRPLTPSCTGRAPRGIVRRDT